MLRRIVQFASVVAAIERRRRPRRGLPRPTGHVQRSDDEDELHDVGHAERDRQGRHPVRHRQLGVDGRQAGLPGGGGPRPGHPARPARTASGRDPARISGALDRRELRASPGSTHRVPARPRHAHRGHQLVARHARRHRRRRGLRPEPDDHPVPRRNPALPSHADDRAELLNRTCERRRTPRATSADDAAGQSFLDWFPSVAGATPGRAATNGSPRLCRPSADGAHGDAHARDGLRRRSSSGAHYYGCGIESQLESWYRFLVQPDPYDSIVIDGSGHAQWSGVDATIIKQRHDFLRPDSLVAIIDLTDENDSEIDVRSFGGQGYKFMDQTFQPPRGTSHCAATPRSSEVHVVRLRRGHGLRPGLQDGPVHDRRRPGLLHQRPPRPHDAEVRHRSPVPARALRPRPHEPEGARPRPRVPVGRDELPGRHRLPRTTPL